MLGRLPVGQRTLTLGDEGENKVQHCFQAAVVVNGTDEVSQLHQPAAGVVNKLGVVSEETFSV